MDVYDFLLTPLYLALIYFLAARTRSKHQHDPIYVRFYLKGLNYKLFGVMGFIIIYLFYYGGGDTTSYYFAIKPVSGLLFKNPSAFFNFCFFPNAPYPMECMYEAAEKGVIYLLRGSPTLTTIRIGALLGVLGMGAFFPLSLLFCYVTYLFEWRLFRLLCSVYPTLSEQLAFPFLYIPSVLFWGSGIGKDAIMFGSIMFFIYCFYTLFIIKKQVFKYLILLVFTGFLISLIRSFILFTLVPCSLLMAVTYYQNSIRSSALRFLVGPALLIGALVASYLLVNTLGSSVESYKIDSLQQKAEGFRSWHTTQGGSTYSIGSDENMDFSAGSIAKQAPVALITCLYGPFIWQVRNPVMLLSALESMFLLYLTLKLIFNKRIYAIFKVLLADHWIVFCVPFVFILAIAIGLTSFNYGALVRYRIPVLPFLGLLIIIINYHLNKPVNS